MSTDWHWHPARMKRQVSIAILLPWFCLLIVFKTGWCPAATFTWNGSVSSDWFNNTNWIPVGVPGPTDTINFANGTIINLTSSVTINGAFNWSGGSLSGNPLTIANGGVMNIAGNVSLQNVVTNAGTVTMTGTASLNILNNHGVYQGGVYNLAGALWDIQTNANINCGCYGFEFFNNAGVFQKSQGSGTTTVGVSFANTGMVNALVGILSFNASFTTIGGTLAFGVGGLSSFGKINVSGNVALNGIASVTWLGGFTPAIGNSFALLDYGSHSGTFANITLPPGTTGQGNYGTTVFSLLITNVTTLTNPPVFLSIELVNANTAVILWPTSAANFSLQTSTNLSTGSWSNVTSGIAIVSTNYVLTNHVNGKAGFFRLQSQ